MARIQVRRGLEANLPTSGMLAGELMATTDQGTMHVATDPTTKIPVVPDVAALSAIPSVDGAADLMLIIDASEASGPRAKRITIDALKTALNIPAGSSDEKVAAVAGGTSGYLFGTDGTDGVLRVDASLVMSKDGSNGFVTLGVGVIDGGTF